MFPFYLQIIFGLIDTQRERERERERERDRAPTPDVLAKSRLQDRAVKTALSSSGSNHRC